MKTKPTREHMQEIGRIGGLAKTPAKKLTSPTNGRKGGRPKNVKEAGKCPICNRGFTPKMLEIAHNMAAGNVHPACLECPPDCAECRGEMK
ncbi:MAG: hypothetical protein HN769_05120 [Anaerolineae bacterium]|jgi:hypothetical protein|nr:hypothetical protein [Anaerolineae bacterium]